MSDFQATGDTVILKLSEEEKVTDSGFIIPAHIVEVPNTGVVVSVGPGEYDSHGRLIPMTVNVGDTVVFSHGAAYGIELEGVHYVTVPLRGILAVIEDN